jgi:predicted helicase/SOS-response transcriptional repressor LexA
MTALESLLAGYRDVAATHREAGTYFEELTTAYFRSEPKFHELYRQVLPFEQWAASRGLDRRDTGIDLVAETFANELHAIQCKLYAPDYRLQKADIDSFFTASGKAQFSRRIIVSTTNHWSEHAEEALRDQQPPVTKIDLAELERSAIDWSRYAPRAEPVLKRKKTLLPHQSDALTQVIAGLGEHDRGKLIMACGTGKTFTSLKIAEQLAGEGKRVLFLVPSLALLSQALTEWTQESAVPLASFAVCSDSDVGKKRKKDDDTVQTFVHELQYPATTDAARLAAEVAKRHDPTRMSVVYATYHSIDVVHDAQAKHGLPPFDLVVCDEAHRTTGVKFDGLDESHFIKVHDAKFLRASKRIYMTATPRIYGDAAKAKAETDNVVVCSMDDEALYGPQLYVITFSEAVKRGLLVDYKVIVLAVEEKHVSRRIQGLLKDENNQLRMDDASKIVGCWKALSKQGLEEELAGDREPMKRAVAFCQVIEIQKGAQTGKVSSKNIAAMFQAVVDAYQESAPPEERCTQLRCEAAHVDGGMNASEKEAQLQWLKDEPPDGTSRILSNVRCLSEGVDVPALDAVLFLTPRNSQIDVVQSVGRVMRTAPGKTRGYIVLPVVIPADMEPHEALNDNQTYKVVWQVLQALRSHDDRFDAMINKLELIGRDPSKMEVVAITDKVPAKPKKRATAADEARRAAKGQRGIGEASTRPSQAPEQRELEFHVGEIERAIYAKLVQKVGNRHHWEDWAKDIAKIAQTHIDRITGILEDEANVREREAFAQFAEELRDDLNPSVKDDEIIEMLAQHLVTQPVFEALFAGNSFALQNSMSKAMQSVLDVLHEHHLEKETSTLQRFYDSVKLRAEGIKSAEGKQKIVVELYDKFFRSAFPKMSERLGIVYTPVEIVDFILHSVDHLLRTEFGQTIGSEQVHILDPFTGTGTFISRLIQSGLITREELPRKYGKEIHANEIVLLAYYIAAINIEAAYHGVVGGEYHPFEGICLTDTFQLYEKDDLISRVLVDNSARRTRQKKLDIRVIIGNPPYSVGQTSQNDNNQNVGYPSLDARISETYAARSSAVLKTALYDSYIRAIRWASDRVGDSGIIGFVTNANFVEASMAQGLRKCLAEEFSSLYVFHLRGNARTSGELRRMEAGNAFGGGSRAPVAISMLVKNAKAKERGRIRFRDIGEYMSREEKLETVAGFGSVASITKMQGWTQIIPDVHGDWLKQRDEGFSRYIVLGDKSETAPVLFANYSNGVKTNRDAWACGPSRSEVAAQMGRMIAFYNSEVARFDTAYREVDKKTRDARIDGFINTDPSKMSWDRPQKAGVVRGRQAQLEEVRIVPSLYRAFTKQWLYFDSFFNNCVYQMPRLFPAVGTENRVIGVSGVGSRPAFSCLMTEVVPIVDVMEKAQFFPLYLYDGASHSNSDDDPQVSLFAAPKKSPNGTARRDGITDAGLAHFRAAHPGETITKEDIFYYVYGLLHSPDYRERYADNLGKELPRIPRLKTAKDFWAFSRAGRALGELHVGYEKVPEYAATVTTTVKTLGPAQYRVEKMKFGKGKDRTVVHYNDFITVTGIPLAAYDYVVNGKSAIEWVMERQSVTTDKASGIVKDANLWATETVGDARYPLSLLLRVITVSLETMNIVRALPALDIADDVAEGAQPKTPGAVLPFRRVVPAVAERYRSAVPLVELRAAAGRWSESQEDVREIDDDSPDVEWVTWDAARPFAKGMFVARVRGKSMEPTIPDGSYCLFRRVKRASDASRPVLVRYAGVADPETGGQYTVKLYTEQRDAKGRVARVVLSPLNTSYPPIVLSPEDEGDVAVIAEVVEVLSIDRAAALQAVEARIETLGELKAGWLDGHGESASGAALGRSREVLRALLAEHPDIDAPGIFPTPTGAIQAEWDSGPWATEIVFAADGRGVEGAATNSSTLEDRTTKFTQTAAGALAAEVASWLRTIWGGVDV